MAHAKLAPFAVRTSRIALFLAPPRAVTIGRSPPSVPGTIAVPQTPVPLFPLSVTRPAVVRLGDVIASLLPAPQKLRQASAGGNACSKAAGCQPRPARPQRMGPSEVLIGPVMTGYVYEEPGGATKAPPGNG